MRKLTLSEFQNNSTKFRQTLLSCDYLAKFCSDQDWQCAAAEHLHGFEFGVEPPGETLIVEDSDNWLVFTERRDRIFFPFEAAWMFGCPLVGDTVATIELLERTLEHHLDGGPAGFVISGVRQDSPLHQEIDQLSLRARKFELFETTDCLTIDLSAGFDAFLSRRSRSFRKSVRQMKPLDLEYQDASKNHPAEVFTRILDLQSRSHKAADGDIFAHPAYESFYRQLYQSLHQRGAIRTLFAQHQGRDIAYIMGGVTGDIYRGFQMSYDEEYRAYSLGNRLQLENLQRCAEQGINHYDLGMHSEYKERWADNWEHYQGCFIVL